MVADEQDLDALLRQRVVEYQVLTSGTTPASVDAAVQALLNQGRGWHLVPQAGLGTPENALVRHDKGLTDLITIPQAGHWTVLRLSGAPLYGEPRRTGAEVWRHLVPPLVALAWARSDVLDDALLRLRQSGESP